MSSAKLPAAGSSVLLPTPQPDLSIYRRLPPMGCFSLIQRVLPAQLGDDASKLVLDTVYYSMTLCERNRLVDIAVVST
jgi:hypothetical protein